MKYWIFNTLLVFRSLYCYILSGLPESNIRFSLPFNFYWVTKLLWLTSHLVLCVCVCFHPFLFVCLFVFVLAFFFSYPSEWTHYPLPFHNYTFEKECYRTSLYIIISLYGISVKQYEENIVTFFTRNPHECKSIILIKPSLLWHTWCHS